MPRTIPISHLLILTLAVAILSLPAQSLALSAADILQPYKYEQEVCKQALRELERQAGLQMDALAAHAAILEKRLEDLAASEEALKQYMDTEKEVMQRAVLTAWQLVQDMEDMVHVHGQGFVTMEQLLQRRDGKRQEMLQTWEAVEQGEHEFFIPGLGMVSRNALQARIEEGLERIQKLQGEIEQGFFVIHHPVYGLVDRQKLEKQAAFLEERIATVQDEISRGDYVVVLPHLGPTSRNQLDARIADIKGQVRALTERFNQGLVTIMRAGIDEDSVQSRQWTDQKAVQQSLEEAQARQQEVSRQLKEKTYELMLPGGALTASDLKDRIATLASEIQAIEAQINDRSYAVALPDGTWATERELDKALVNALLAPEIRERLETGRKAITVSAKAEVLIRSLEKAKLEVWLKDFDKYAKPHLDILGHDLAWKKTLLRDFVTEQKTAIDALNGKITWMERLKHYIP
jgi:uncharacterized small protein (DUF1192 family)